MFDWVLSIFQMLEIKTPERRHSRCSVNFNADFEHISHIGFHVYFRSFTYILDIAMLPLLNLNN